ncbi:MAG: hypothetical protein WAL75_10355 [Terracidiphilus sp.]
MIIRNQQFGVSILAALCAALPALAQSQTSAGPAQRPPYTIEFKTTRVQTLANGTTITTETKEVVASDQQGRRVDSTTNAPTGDRPAITFVRVNDPFTGDEISWSSATNVARGIRRPVGDARRGCWATPDSRTRANYGAGPANQGIPQDLRPPAPPAAANVPVNSPLAQSSSAPHFPIVVTGPDGQNVTMVGVKHTPGEAAPAAFVEHNVARQDLGADTIMGVEVRGSRTTITTPAGAMGNDQPLVSTNEIWMAASLGLVLRSVSDDPRMGKTNREVVSLDLNAPDPALFQPPAGYQLDTEVMQPVPCAQ